MLNCLDQSHVMLYYTCNITWRGNMSRGPSGRVVIEIDPTIKQRLYIALINKNMTLKDWFLDNISLFIRETEQPSLFLDSHNNKLSMTDEGIQDELYSK